MTQSFRSQQGTSGHIAWGSGIFLTGPLGRNSAASQKLTATANASGGRPARRTHTTAGSPAPADDATYATGASRIYGPRNPGGRLRPTPGNWPRLRGGAHCRSFRRCGSGPSIGALPAQDQRLCFAWRGMPMPEVAGTTHGLALSSRSFGCRGTFGSSWRRAGGRIVDKPDIGDRLDVILGT